jgi:hypothetical protein
MIITNKNFYGLNKISQRKYHRTALQDTIDFNLNTYRKYVFHLSHL